MSETLDKAESIENSKRELKSLLVTALNDYLRPTSGSMIKIWTPIIEDAYSRISDFGSEREIFNVITEVLVEKCELVYGYSNPVHKEARLEFQVQIYRGVAVGLANKLQAETDEPIEDRADTAARTNAHIRKTLNIPRNSDNLMDVHVSDTAIQIVSDIKAAYENNSPAPRSTRGPKRRMEYVILATLAQEMVSGQATVKQHQIADITGYRYSTIVSGITSAKRMLDETGFDIIGSKAAGWRLVKLHSRFTED